MLGLVVRISYLSNSTIPSLAANSVQVMKMCAAFAKRGHSVTLFARKNPELSEEPYSFYGLEPTFQLSYLSRTTPPKKGTIAKALFKWLLRKRVRSASSDLIYSRNPLALSTVASLQIPFILEDHRLHLKTRRAECLNWLLRQPNFSRLVLITNALKQDYLPIFPFLDESKVLIAPDGADVPLSLPKEVSLTGGIKVGYAGHLYPGKGMEIISKLPTRCPWAHFHVVGGREETVIYWRSQLTSWPNITLHGFVPHREIVSYLLAFDVVLAPYQTRVEARSGVEIGRWMSPLKLFEYMALGKAIIASDLPVLREVLEHGRNALLVPPDDVDAWANAITTLHNDGALRQRLGQQALRAFNTSYSWNSRAKLVLEGLDISG